MFADDTKLWKCKDIKVMQIGRKGNVNYHLGSGMDIVNLTEAHKMEKDLGVWIDKDFKWSHQCRKAASKAMSVLGMIKQSFKHIDIESFKILYSTYIRPHLEYCVQV